MALVGRGDVLLSAFSARLRMDISILAMLKELLWPHVTV